MSVIPPDDFWDEIDLPENSPPTKKGKPFGFDGGKEEEIDLPPKRRGRPKLYIDKNGDVHEGAKGTPVGINAITGADLVFDGDKYVEQLIELSPEEQRKKDIREKFKKRKKEKIDFVLPVSAIEYNRQAMYSRPPQRYLLGNSGNIVNIEQGLKHEEYTITFIIDSGIVDGLVYSKGALSLSLPKQRSRYAFYGMIKEICKDIIIFTGITDLSSLRYDRVTQYPAKSLYLTFQEEKEKYVRQMKKDKDKDRLMVRKLIF